MPGRRLDRRHGLARRADRDAARPRVHRHEARGRRLGASGGAGARRARDPAQRDLPRLHGHAARRGRASATRSASRSWKPSFVAEAALQVLRRRGDRPRLGRAAEPRRAVPLSGRAGTAMSPRSTKAVGRVPAARPARLEHAPLPRHRAGRRPRGDRVGRDAGVQLPRAERPDRPRRHGRGAPRHGDGRRLLDADDRGRGLPHRRPPHGVPPLGAARDAAGGGPRRAAQPPRRLLRRRAVPGRRAHRERALHPDRARGATELAARKRWPSRHNRRSPSRQDVTLEPAAARRRATSSARRLRPGRR